MLRTEFLADFQGESKIVSRNHVGATAGAGQLVDFGFGEFRINCRAPQSPLGQTATDTDSRLPPDRAQPVSFELTSRAV